MHSWSGNVNRLVCCAKLWGERGDGHHDYFSNLWSHPGSLVKLPCVTEKFALLWDLKRQIDVSHRHSRLVCGVNVEAHKIQKLYIWWCDREKTTFGFAVESPSSFFFLERERVFSDNCLKLGEWEIFGVRDRNWFTFEMYFFFWERKPYFLSSEMTEKLQRRVGFGKEKAIQKFIWGKEIVLLTE